MKNLFRTTTNEQYAALLLLLNSILSLVLSYSSTRYTNSITIHNDMVSYVIDITYYAAIAGLIFKIKRENEYNFNYCTGKIEASISLLTGLLLSLYIIYVAIAVYDQFYEMIPFESSYNVLTLYVLMMFKNILVLFIVNKLIKNHQSTILECGNVYAISCVIDNVITIIPIIVYIFSSSNAGILVIYVDIGCSIVLGLTNLYFVFPLLKSSTNQLLDRALEEEMMLRILKVLAKHYDLYDNLVSLRSRETGGIKYIELYMEFDGELKYSEVLANMAQLKISLEQEITKTTAKIIPVIPEK